MRRPDFAQTSLAALTDRDVRLLIERMPRAGASYDEISELLRTMPSTVESMLTSEYAFELIFRTRRLLLDVSPFLLFSVLLRRALAPPRGTLERRVINYLANLLTLFVHTGRLFRVEPEDHQGHHYVLDLIAEAQAADARRQFLTYAHIGNYALFVSGLRAQWLEHRERFHRRPVDARYYADFGRSYFERAARHPMAQELSLDDVFLRLAMSFDHYRSGLERMVRQYFPSA